MYTSGTTGRPKGVLVTHRMLCLAGEAAALVSTARDGDVFFVWEPLFHIGGAQFLIVPMLRRVVLAMVARFSAGKFWEQVRAERASHIHYLGGILQILLSRRRGRWTGRTGCGSPGAAGVRRRSGGVRGAVRGADPGMLRDDRGFEHDDVQRWRPGRLGRQADAVVQVELLMSRAGRPRAAKSWCVRMSGCADSGIFPQPGRDGVGTARQHTAFRRYRLGRRGRELLLPRTRTDSVRCRGENVSAFEVEHVAAAQPSVEDCAMIGVAADVGEQDIKLFVKRRAGLRDRSGRAVGLAGRAAGGVPEPALPLRGRGVRAHAEPAHHEASALEGCFGMLRPGARLRNPAARNAQTSPISPFGISRIET